MTIATSYLSTAIPYVNGAPHVGHALEFVVADATARHRRRIGQDVRFQSGTDDNSLKNARAAAKLGVSTSALVARHAAEFRDLAALLDVRFDDFVGTSSDPRHGAAVERLWRACERAGDIERRTYSGLYCAGCEEFFAPGELPGDRCAEHDAPLERIEEENYFFRAGRYSDAVRRAIESGALSVWPEERRREVLRFLSAGLHDFSVSRSTARAHAWGLPVPGDPTQVVYVWFDALANYLSGLGYATDAPDFARHWTHASDRTHVIGKGILRFHAAYWPAILLSAGLPLPTEILVHGYVTAEGRKVGKSLGNAIDAAALVRRHGADAVRYYVLRHLHTTADSDFVEARLVATHDAELADQLGNLLRRSLTLVHRHFDGRIPEPGPETAEDATLRHGAREALDAQQRAFTAFDLNDAAAIPLALLVRANRYFDAQAPWTITRGGDRGRIATALFTALEAAWHATWLLEPIVPRAAARIRDDLGGHEAVTVASTGELTWNPLPHGGLTRLGEPHFPRLSATRSL